MPKPKRRKRPEPADAWSWLRHRAAAVSIDLRQMSLTEAAHSAVSRLEAQRDAGLPSSPEAVQVAALLVRLVGEWVAWDVSSAEPLVERAYVREWARWLAQRYAANQRVWTRPSTPKPLPPKPVPQPEPEPEPMVTLFDLVREFQMILEKHALHLPTKHDFS